MKITRQIDLVMKALYASEINCGVQSFWDGLWEAWLGDDRNGRKVEDFNIEFDDLGDWLHEAALKFYPNSTYARNATAPSFAANGEEKK